MRCWPLRERTGLVVLIAVAVAVSGILSFVYLTGHAGVGTLPPGCTKPPGGFLVIASGRGYNDSIDHGAPQTSWPVITVAQNTTVEITVCNVDTQAHGFQISHYFDSAIQSLGPQQVIHVDFLASKAGTFDIYCSVFCTIHLFMQNGQLRVV